MATAAYEQRQDNNSLGKAAGIVGIIALVLSFIPIIGFVSWLLAPLAVLFALVAMRKAPRSWAIVGAITGALAFIICLLWVQGAKGAGEAMSADTFNTTGEARDLSDAPIIDADIQELWGELEDNKVAAGQKYGGNRLAFSDEIIADFSGDASSPALQIVGHEDGFMSYFVTAQFDESAGETIASLAKGDAVSFVCTEINETFGDGYNLSGCSLR